MIKQAQTSRRDVKYRVFLRSHEYATQYIQMHVWDQVRTPVETLLVQVIEDISFLMYKIQNESI